jgi:Xaa-Pro dipeptidase
MQMVRATVEPPEIDLAAMRRYRLNRLRGQLRERQIAMCVLVNPISLRYAADLREYQGFQSRIPSQYMFVPAEGPVVMHGASHRHYEGIDDYRAPLRLNVFDGGLELGDQARQFADALNAYLSEIGLGGERRVAIEMLNPSVTQAVLQAGLEAVDAEPVVERAKSIKCEEEIACMRHSIAVAEHGMALMQENTQPGIRETELWSIMHQVNMAHDGDWFDGRMLCSGPRTNPWLQEASSRVIEAGDFVAFDTDMVGPFGYCADISRTWLCGPAEPTEQQRAVYRLAWEEVHHNIGLIRPGLGFLELSHAVLRQPDAYVARRYPCPAHGIGMSDEYPKIYYPQDIRTGAYDGVIEENMTLCIESYCGSENGGPGVKLEQMVRVTASGCEVLTTYPFEETLLA